MYSCTATGWDGQEKHTKHLFDMIELSETAEKWNWSIKHCKLFKLLQHELYSYSQVIEEGTCTCKAWNNSFDTYTGLRELRTTHEIRPTNM